MVEKNGKTQNEINERIRKVSKFYHLIKSILWNNDIAESVKPQYTMCTLRRCYYMEWRHRCARRVRKEKYKLNEILEVNNW
jgi:hypothetical protein